jgi:hypothetical protein
MSDPNRESVNQLRVFQEPIGDDCWRWIYQFTTSKGLIEVSHLITANWHKSPPELKRYMQRKAYLQAVNYFYLKSPERRSEKAGGA